MEKYLCHKSVVIRFLSLYLFGIILFIIAWMLSYAFLPEGIIKGKSIASQAVGGEVSANIIKEFITIFTFNIFAGLLIVLANITLKIKSYPLGYLIPILWLINYGMLLGTNSFGIPMESTMAPSFAVLKRSGLYEMMAYSLLAVATYSISRNRMEKVFTRKSVPIKKEDRKTMKTEQWVAIVIAVIVLLLANLREAFMLMNL